MATAIPRIIHQVWLGPRSFPEKFAAFQDTWRLHHPDWELRFWTEELLPPDLRCRAIYERLREPVERCDLMRLECLWRDGGVYVDCDFECLRPIDPLLEGTDFFVAYIGPRRVNHALMGSTQGHEILDRALREARPREFYGYDKEATGPAFFNTLLANYPDTTIYPSSFFYPVGEDEREQAYAVHHAERSWADAESLRARLDKAHKRLERSEHQLADVRQRLANRKEQLADRDRQLRALRGEIEGLHAERNRRLARRVARVLQQAAGRRHEPKVIGGGAEASSVGRRVNRARRTHPQLRKYARRFGKRLRKRAAPLRKRVRTDAKRARRRLRALYDARYRPTYRTTLSLVPSRNALPDVLNSRGLIGTGVEVGVRVGRYSQHLLDHWRGERLISIDPWREVPPDEYLDHNNEPQDVQEQYYERTKGRLAHHRGRSEIWRTTSVEGAEQIGDGTVDFVYIDARHDYASVCEDLAAWFPKLRSGGILAGHDYFDGEYKGTVFRVRSAVDDFFGARGIRVYHTRETPPRFPSWLVEIEPDGRSYPRRS